MNSTDKRAQGDQASPGRGLIGLGDLMRAVDLLDSRDAVTMARIARALGFTGVDANPAEGAQGVAGVQRRPRRVSRSDSRRPPLRGAVPTPPVPVALPDRVFESDIAAVATSDTRPERPAWLDSGPALRSIAPVSAPRARLIPDRAANGVLGAAVATRRPGPSPDVHRMIGMIVRGGVLTGLPYRQHPSLHRGLQLLMDTSESMTPFLQDLDDLARALVQVVGAHACELYEFTGDPARAVRWSGDFREIAWRPVAGRPVVVASDFGIGARAGARDRASLQSWLRFEHRVRAAGLPVIAFVPHGRDRWRKSLSRRIHFIHWDPHTRASNVRKLFGLGHQVGP